MLNPYSPVEGLLTTTDFDEKTLLGKCGALFLRRNGSCLYILSQRNELQFQYLNGLVINTYWKESDMLEDLKAWINRQPLLSHSTPTILSRKRVGGYEQTNQGYSLRVKTTVPALQILTNEPEEISSPFSSCKVILKENIKTKEILRKKHKAVSIVAQNPIILFPNTKGA